MYTDDPDDTLVLDPVIRHIGQRVAAVARRKSEGIAEAACRLTAPRIRPLTARPSMRRRPCSPARMCRPRQAAFLAHSQPAAQTSSLNCMAISAMSRMALPRQTPFTRAPIISSVSSMLIWKPTAPSVGSLDGDGRSTCALSYPGAVPDARDALCALFDLPQEKIRASSRSASAVVLAASRR